MMETRRIWLAFASALAMAATVHAAIVDSASNGMNYLLTGYLALVGLAFALLRTRSLPPRKGMGK